MTDARCGRGSGQGSQGARLLKSDISIRHEEQVGVAGRSHKARWVLVEAPQAVHWLWTPRGRCLTSLARANADVTVCHLAKLGY